MLAALMLLVQAAPAPAATTAVIAVTAAAAERADARCVAAFAAMATSDADTQRASQLGVIYFYGRLVGRRPGLDLKPLILEATGPVASNLKAELTQCGTELQRAGTAMQAAEEAIEADVDRARRLRLRRPPRRDGSGLWSSSPRLRARGSGPG